MSNAVHFLSDGHVNDASTSPLVPPPNPGPFTMKLSANERTGNKNPTSSNLNTKITPFHSPSFPTDPFKNLYRAEWAAHLATEERQSATSRPTAPRPPSAGLSADSSDSSDKQLVTNLTGKFTLKRVIALRKVQQAMQSAPNASAVRAHSTCFSEDDLKCLTIEELQALQNRNRAIHKQVQPLSVVKASIQAERSKKRLEPRDYQLELYERARRENTIAVLGTGTGKTLIACLLIKDILIQERVNRAAGEKVLWS